MPELSLGTTDVEADSGGAVADTILTQAQPKLILSQLFKTAKVPEGYDWIRIPQRPIATIVVSQNVDEATSIEASTYSYTGKEVHPSKSGIRFEIDTEAFESASRELLADLFSEGASEWSKVKELNAFTVSLDLQTSTFTEGDFVDGTLATGTFTPIVQIISCTFNTGSISSVDYADGKVALSDSISTGTVVYSYSDLAKNNGFYYDVTDAGKLRLSDVLKLRSTLTKNSLSPDVCVLNDVDINSLVNDSSISPLFVHKKEYTQQDNLLNGELGVIGDLRLLTSALIPEGVCVIADSSRLGYNVVKRELEGFKEDKPEFDQIWYHLWEESTFVVSDTLAVGVLVNFKTGEYAGADL